MFPCSNTPDSNEWVVIQLGRSLLMTIHLNQVCWSRETFKTFLRNKDGRCYLRCDDWSSLPVTRRCPVSPRSFPPSSCAPAASSPQRRFCPGRCHRHCRSSPHPPSFSSCASGKLHREGWLVSSSQTAFFKHLVPVGPQWHCKTRCDKGCSELY